MDVKFGPTGQAVYNRTYARTKPDGTKEEWPDTVRRVAEGNLKLVYGPPSEWGMDVACEYASLVDAMLNFKILPAGRHLWASGVEGRQYLFNCHVAGWGEEVSEHFTFTFLRLMEGGGVGSNYSMKNIRRYGPPKQALDVHIVCDPSHPDYQAMLDAGLLSDTYASDWAGAYLIEDSREGWAAGLADLLETFWRDDVQHSDRVYDVTNVRAAGSRLRTFGGTASGPAPFARMMMEVGDILSAACRADRLTPLAVMAIDHSIASCVVAGGNRRSARMAMVDWDDPYVFDFINCKEDTSEHWTTNISVAVDDHFTKLIASPTNIYDPKWVQADNVHNAVVTGMLANGEPGYWNQSLSNLGEPTPVVCTNPCLTGDTVIATVDGARTFADLAESGDDVQVYSWHPKTKMPVIRWMRNRYANPAGHVR